MDGVLPGTYSVSARGSGYELYGDEHTAEVGPDGCAQIDLRMAPNNRLTGTLRNSEGRPIPNVIVDLGRVIVATVVEVPKTTSTGDDGTYTFKNLLPGDYLLGLNLIRNPTSSRPFARQYYPGVREPHDAAPIRIIGSEHLTGYDLTIDASIPTREVRVRVRWWDGAPVTNASILCRVGRDGKDYDDDTLGAFTDENGSATLKALASQQLEIFLLGLSWETTGPMKMFLPAGTPTLHLQAAEEPAEVTFVIPEGSDMRARLKPQLRRE